MMNDYKFNKLLSDTITLPILPANKFSNTDTGYYAVLEKNYIPITSTIECIYKPDWITGYNFSTEDKYYNKLYITSINDNTEKKLRKGLMEFTVINNISDNSRFISGINHIYAKVSQAPYEEVGVHLEFIPTDDQKKHGLSKTDKDENSKDIIIGGSITGDEQEIHLKYYGILNGRNQSNAILTIDGKTLDQTKIKSLKINTSDNSVELIYLIDENIKVDKKTISFTVTFSTQYNKEIKTYSIDQQKNNYELKLGIDSIDNTIANNILYNGETKKLLYTCKLNGNNIQSDNIKLIFEFINETYELNYTYSNSSYNKSTNMYECNVIINPNYTLQERKVKVYIIYKNNIKSNEIIITQSYDKNIKIQYIINEQTYDISNSFTIKPFGEIVDLQYYAITSDGHKITSMSNIKYVDNNEIIEYDEIRYIRREKPWDLYDYTVIKDVKLNDYNNGKVLQLQFPQLNFILNRPEIYIDIYLSKLKINNITFRQDNFKLESLKTNISEKSTKQIGGIPEFSEITLIFNAINKYGDEEVVVTDSNLFTINFFDGKDNNAHNINNRFNINEIQYDIAEYNDVKYIVASNIRLNDEYFGNNRTFYYEITYQLANDTVSIKNDRKEILQKSLQYDCNVTSKTNIVSFKGDDNFIVKGYGIVFNDEDELHKTIQNSQKYYTTKVSSCTVSGNTDILVQNPPVISVLNNYTNIKLNIKQIQTLNSDKKILTVICKYKHKLGSYETTASVTITQSHINLYLEVYKQLDDLESSTNKLTNNYVLENALVDTILYIKYYMVEIDRDNNQNVVNLKDYNSNITFNYNTTDEWIEYNINPTISNIQYNDENNYYYGIINIPKNLLYQKATIEIKYEQTYDTITYAYVNFYIIKNMTVTYTDNNNKTPYIPKNNNEKEQRKTVYLKFYKEKNTTDSDEVYSVTVDSSTIDEVNKDIDIDLQYNVTYSYTNNDNVNWHIDTISSNFSELICTSEKTPYYTLSDRKNVIKNNDTKQNYITQILKVKENINPVEQSIIFNCKYVYKYMQSKEKQVKIILKQAIRVYNFFDNEHVPENILKQIDDNHQIELTYNTLEQEVNLYLTLYCNSHIDYDYKQNHVNKENVQYENIVVKPDDIKGIDKARDISIKDNPIYDNDNKRYSIKLQLDNIVSYSNDKEYRIYYQRTYTYYNYNNDKEVEDTCESNTIIIKRKAYNNKNYTLSIDFYINSKKVNEQSIGNIQQSIDIYFYLKDNTDEKYKDIPDNYEFTLSLDNDNIVIDEEKISKKSDEKGNIYYQYIYEIPQNIAETEKILNGQIKINDNFKKSTYCKQNKSVYDVKINDTSSFDNINNYIEINPGIEKQITLYFKGIGGEIDKKHSDKNNYILTCSLDNIVLSNIINNNSITFNDDGYFSVICKIPENETVSSYQDYIISVTYNPYLNISKKSILIIRQYATKIKSCIQLVTDVPDNKISNIGQDLIFYCWGLRNDITYDPNNCELIINDSSSQTSNVVIEKLENIEETENGVTIQKAQFKVTVPISTVDRKLTFKSKYIFKDNNPVESETIELSQESGDFELFVHAYYMRGSTKVEDDMDELALKANDAGYFYLQYYAQVKNGTYIDTDQTHYKITYEKYNDGDMTYEYPVDFKTEETTLKDNKLELKCKFSQNPTDSDYDYERCVNFIIKYNIGSVDNKTMLINQASAFAIGLASFDFLLFEYIFLAGINNGSIKDPSKKNTLTGRDLDTITHITNNKNIKMTITSHDKTYILNNTTLGFSQTLYPSGTQGYWHKNENYTEYEDILGFSGDNISGSQESVFINMKEILSQIRNTLLINKCKYIYIDLYGHMYSILDNGRVKVTYRTFKNKGSNPSITLDRSTEKYIFNTTDTEVNQNLAKTYDLTVQEANLQGSYTWLARLTYNVKTGNGQLDSRNLYGYKKSTDNGLTVFNRTYVDKNPACFYICGYKQYNDTITLKTINISYSDITTDSSTYSFDSDDYLCSTFNGNNSVGVHWQRFNSFSVSDSNGINCTFDRLTFKFNIKQTYVSYNWPTEANKTRDIIVNTNPAYDNIKFVIQIIEQKNSK